MVRVRVRVRVHLVARPALVDVLVEGRVVGPQLEHPPVCRCASDDVLHRLGPVRCVVDDEVILDDERRLLAVEVGLTDG